MTKVSKYDVLNLLAKKMAFYAATQWLKLPKDEFGGDSPADLLNENKIEKVYAALKKDLGIVD
jgi:hypothetical protein